jgi:hypothetical protein
MYSPSVMNEFVWVVKLDVSICAKSGIAYSMRAANSRRV